MSLQILVAERDPKLRNQTREALRETDYEVVGLARDGEEAVQLALQLNPSIALLAYDLPGVSGLQACEIISALAPDIMPVLIAESRTSDRIDHAMHAGARAFMSRPVDAAKLCDVFTELGEIFERRRSKETLEWREPSRFSKVISVTGAKGGVGKTTIAVNLAAALAQKYQDNVALIDLHSQFGDVASMLNIVPKLTIADIGSLSGELDPEMVSKYISKHPSGINVLVAATKLAPIDSISAGTLEELLYILKGMYRYIIVDAPAIVGESILRVLTNSYRILMVANLLDLTAVADTKKLYDALLEEQIPREKMQIVLNRSSRANRISNADIESMFEGCTMIRVPEDSHAINAGNGGVPLVLGEGEPAFRQSINELAESVSTSIAQ